MHRLFLASAIGGAAQDHRFPSLRMACELDCDAIMNNPPTVCALKLHSELLQLCLRRADDVASAGLAQPRESRVDDHGNSHAAPADWPSPRPQNTYSSRRRAAPFRTSRPCGTTRAALPTRSGTYIRWWRRLTSL